MLNHKPFKLSLLLLAIWTLSAGSHAARQVEMAPQKHIVPAEYTPTGVWPGGDVVLDTDFLTINGVPGGIIVDRFGRDVALFVFAGDLRIEAGAKVSVRGQLPLAFAAQGEIVVSGTIEMNGLVGADGMDGGAATGGGAGGPGGFDGGSGASCPSSALPGSGPGGGGPGPSSANPAWGGGGGGFGSAGNSGDGIVGGAGGPAYGDLLDSRIGGSGGGGGGAHCSIDQHSGGSGGGGGGLVELIATHTVSILGGSLIARGGDGGSGFGNAGGGAGGSGGAVYIEAFNVEIEPGSVIDVRGGAGGAGIHSGGDGGGGRIVIVSNTSGRFCDQTIGTIQAGGGEYSHVSDPAVGMPRPVPSLMPLDPEDFAAISTFPTGDVVFDTDALTVNGMPGGVLHDQGPCRPKLAVFVFQGGAVLGAANTLSASGRRPLGVLVRGDFDVQGSIALVAANGSDGGSGVSGSGGVSALGGFAGGHAVGFGSPPGTGLGSGPGGGVQGTSSVSVGSTSAGHGGGFGGTGSNVISGGGSTYGELISELEGGSGGGAGGSIVTFFLSGGGGGGAGGGAIHISASGCLSFTGGSIEADGGSGGSGNRPGGGGSGGAILLYGDELKLDAGTTMSARGGGFTGSSGGGGGRIVLSYPPGGLTDLSAPGALDASGGPGAAAGVVKMIVCQRDLGLGSQSLLAMCGDNLVPGGTSRLTFESPVAGGLAVLWFATSFQTALLSGETLLVPNINFFKFFATNAEGQVVIPSIPGDLGPADLYMQMSVFDASTSSGYSPSNALLAEFQ